MKHIKSYELVRRQVIAAAKAELAEANQRLDELREALALVEDGKKIPAKTIAWLGDERDATKTRIVELIDDYERRVDPKPSRESGYYSIVAQRDEQLASLDDVDDVATGRKPPEDNPAGVLKSVEIDIAWRKSKMWGYNPHAKARVYGTNGEFFCGTGRASGCGYDKGSAAIQDALGACRMIKRFVIEHPECWGCYGIGGKRRVPGLSVAGKGVSTFEAIFRPYGGSSERIQEYQDGAKPYSYRGVKGWHVESSGGDHWTSIRIDRIKDLIKNLQDELKAKEDLCRSANAG